MHTCSPSGTAERRQHRAPPHHACTLSPLLPGLPHLGSSPAAHRLQVCPHRPPCSQRAFLALHPLSELLPKLSGEPGTVLHQEYSFLIHLFSFLSLPSTLPCSACGNAYKHADCSGTRFTDTQAERRHKVVVISSTTELGPAPSYLSPASLACLLRNRVPWGQQLGRQAGPGPVTSNYWVTSPVGRRTILFIFFCPHQERNSHKNCL